MQHTRTQEKETQVRFNPGLSANRPSNNWALDHNVRPWTTTTLFTLMQTLLSANQSARTIVVIL